MSKAATTSEEPGDSEEFRLLAALCRPAFARANENVSIAALPGVDWGRVLSLARFHRVQGLVSHSLAGQACGAPEHVIESLSSEARPIAATNLAIARECEGLKIDLDAAGVGALFVKGLTLGTLAYSNPLLK